MKNKSAPTKIPQPGDATGKFDDDAGPSDVYAGEDSKVVKAARERKKGGRLAVGTKAEGKKAHERMDRAPRKKGGRVGGSENSPLTAAKSTSDRPGADIQSKGGMD